jgi:tetraacyldisaccharide 4'-kinase
MRLEARMNEILEGRRPGKRALWLLSLLYQAGIRLRHRAYQYHLFTAQKVPAVVVSVGNIVAGGTGKTPLVHFLAQELSKEHKVAILSRGYRSQAENHGEPTLVEPSMQAENIGDEPLWLAQKLPEIQVWVGRDRAASAKKAVEHGAEILLLDDGFQHRRLHRDFDIVVVSGESPYSNGHFLPRGYLRDLPSRLASATLLAMMGSKRLDLPTPQVFFERTSSTSLQGKKVALFCAIANPERFLNQVQAAGAQITISLIKPDHDFFSIEELEELAQKSKADLLVCTEKDFVKLSSVKTSIPLVPIPLELSISEGDEVWKQLIHQIKSQVKEVQNGRISSHAS